MDGFVLATVGSLWICALSFADPPAAGAAAPGGTGDFMAGYEKLDIVAGILRAT